MKKTVFLFLVMLQLVCINAAPITDTGGKYITAITSNDNKQLNTTKLLV